VREDRPVLDNHFARVGLSAADLPLRGLREVAAVRVLLDRIESQFVAEARFCGQTWPEIGDALGVSRQVARRGRRPDCAELDRVLASDRY
jgi:hypothetical protein